MQRTDKDLYDDGVNRMRSTLEMCDYGITTTGRLHKEMSGYIGEVFINRNVASGEMVQRSQEALAKKPLNSKRVTLGYFSGSITHNEDFALIVPSLVKLMKKNSQVYLKIAGLLDIPPELEEFRSRVIATGFTDWRKLPEILASCDINLAPLTNTVFNDAKSENKWTEASLVKVPTIATDFGAFKTVIEDGKTGILVKKPSDWFSRMDEIVNDAEMRERIGRSAYQTVMSGHTTIETSGHLARFINSKLRRSIAFVLPTTDISGGVTVALKHADVLRNDGWNVTIFDDIHRKALKKSARQYEYRLDIPNYNVVTLCRSKIVAYFDTIVATLWTTVRQVTDYPNVRNRLYLVQGFETEFAPWGSDGMLKANATYNNRADLRYITISMWCKRWLKDKFDKDARYAPNGIDLDNYRVRKRTFKTGRVKILIEGDSRNKLKNTDEAFRIVERLEKSKYHISYLSYHKEPKSWYRVDKFYNRIDPKR